MKKTHFSLIAKFSLIILLILGLAISFFYYREEKREEMAYQRHMEKEIQLMVSLLTKNSSPAQMQSLLDEVHKCWGKVLHIQVIDSHRRIVASTQRGEIGQSVKTDPKQVLSFKLQSQDLNEQVFSFPIKTPSFEGTIRAYIVPADVYEEYLKDKAERRNEAILTFIVALAVLMALTYVVVTRYENTFIAKTAERLRAENEVMTEKIKQSERLAVLGRMAASLAHEIRTPLTSIKNLAQLLEEEHNDPVFRREFQELVISEVERINHIIRALLSYAKPLKLQKNKIRLDNLIEEALDGLKETGQMGKAKVEKVLRPIEIQADKDLIKQVLENIILNACQAMKGEGFLNIRLNQEGQNAVIAIKDSGGGIQEKDKPHIFTPFFTTKAKGTGLGLALCEKIITAHGGKIEFDSQTGVGTTFYIYLPKG